MTGISYAAEQVRLYDHDRFLTAIFAPAQAREHLFALYAFNLEIAKTREVVTEPLVGQMRLQWWRDALDRLYAGCTVAHEVARPLGDAIAAGQLERSLFDRLIDARETDLTDTPPPDLAALELYGENTVSPLLEMALRLLAGRDKDAAGIAEAARDVGIAWALTGLARAVPFHARQRRLYLPQDMMEAAHVRTARLFDLKPDPGLPDVVRRIGEHALGRLAQARRITASVPRRSRSPLLLAELADLYLADMAGAGWDPFAPELRRGRPLALIRLAWRAARGKY